MTSVLIMTGILMMIALILCAIHLHRKNLNEISHDDDCANKTPVPEKPDTTHNTIASIAVDLDGTLAKYDHWRGPENIGEPIMPMVDRVVEWITAGKCVKILTARVSPIRPDKNEAERSRKAIEKWLGKHIIPRLPLHLREPWPIHITITHEKDPGMIQLWDDRCVQLIPNTGRRADMAIEKRDATALAFLTSAIIARDEAVALHPDFPIQFSHGSIAITRSHLGYYRNRNTTCETAESVMMEEFYEFMEAVMTGDAKAAHAEFAQCMAVMIRIGESLPLYTMQYARKEGEV